MEGRQPPDDDLFEWTDTPARSSRRERPADPLEPSPFDTDEPDYGTGERDAFDTGKRAETGGDELDPFDTGEQRRGSRGRGGRGGLLGRRGRRARRERNEPREPRDTGSYEREGRRPPPGRRTRRRDLPARVRRRQDAVVGLIVLAVAGGAYALFLSGGGEDEQPTPLKRLVGQTIVGRLGEKGPDRDFLRRVKKGQIGGVIVLPRNERTLTKQVKSLQEAAEAGGNPRLLVMIDQEGGPVKRLPGPPDQSPAQLGQSGDEDASRDQGAKTGEYLEGFGVNADLAPLLDVTTPATAKTISSRTFGDDPEVVSTLGVAFIDGLQDGGVLATAKHFPGLGPATQNTDQRPVTIAATQEDLDAALLPFRDAVEADVGMVMMSNASYPSLGSKEPAVLAPEVVQGVLREALGYDGVVISDDLETRAITADRTPEKAAGAALKAGVDLVLFATTEDGSSSAFESLVKEAKAGRIDRAAIDAAYERITSLKSTLG